jgi:hypothetical protein
MARAPIARQQKDRPIVAAARIRTHRKRPVGEGVSAEGVAAALELIAASTAFAHSPSLTAFLRFVVEAALAGRGGQLKGYTIAVEALGRPADFDPDTDAIVRVDAGRIRSALTRYYQTDGAHAAVVIHLPRGHYAPTFSRGPPLSAAPRTPVEAFVPYQSQRLRSRAAAQRCRFLLERMASRRAALTAEIASVRETIARARKLLAAPDAPRIDDRSRGERSI